MEVIVIRNTEDYNTKITDGILNQSFHLYVRVSTTTQIENTSLDNQTDLGLDYVRKEFKDKYKTIVVWREEGKSGDDVDEDDGSETVKRELLRIINNKWKGRIIQNLWVYDLSRLSRNDDSSNLLKGLIYKNGIDLYVNQQKYNFDRKIDKLLFGVLSLVNDFENNQRFEKGLMGKIKILEKNKFWGGITPFGYDIGDDGRLVENPFTSKMVKMMFESYNKGKSIKDIGNKLEEIGVKTQRNNLKWGDNSIRKILQNPTYLGSMKYEVNQLKGKSREYNREKNQTKSIEIKTPQLIDKPLFDLVNKRIQKNRKGGKSPIKNEVLLRGLLFCGSCDSTYYGRVNPKQNTNTYSCQSVVKKYRDETSVCENNKSVNISVLDELVWRVVVDIFENSDEVKQKYREENIPKELNNPKIINNQKQSITNKIGRRKTKLIEVEKRRDELMEGYLTTKISKSSLDRLTEVSQNQTNTILEEIKTLETEYKILEGGVIWEEWFEGFEKYLNEIKSYTSKHQRREFIEKVVDKVIVSWDSITSTHNLKINFSINLLDTSKKGMLGKDRRYKNTEDTIQIEELDFKGMYKDYKKSLSLKTSNITYSTVVDGVMSDVNDNVLFYPTQPKGVILKFSVSVKTSKLTKTSHYNEYQQKLYTICKELKSDGLGYRRISHKLIEDGYSTIRSNKPILPNSVYSILKKGEIRENRINREFENYISGVRLYKE